MAAGYYRFSNNNIQFGTSLSLPGGQELTVENHEQHSYPVQGWWWFGTTAAAWDFFNFAPPMDDGDVYQLNNIRQYLTPSAQAKVDRIIAEPQEPVE